MGKHKFNFSKEPINIKESDNEPVLVSNKHFFEKRKKDLSYLLYMEILMM